MHKFRLVTLVAAVGLVLAGCGGSGEESKFSDPGGGTGGGGGGGTVTTAQMGSPAGSGFQAGAMGISSASLSAGGSTSLQVVLQKTDGTLYAEPATVTFNSPCVANGTAAIQPQAAVDTSTGIATATYVAQGCSGSDQVTASATIGGVARSANGTVNVAQAAIGSIAFVSATPTNIALKGTGDASRPESSVVVFRVLDASGGPRAGANVSFVLNTTVGGMTLTPASATATSDAQGQVQIVVNAGTVATSVKVTATVTSTSPQISTQSSQLTVTTGIPTANNISLAVKCFNIEGWDLDGIQTDVTARLADRFQNPVPDGTAVTFHAEGGKIGAQCVTETTATESGVCSVKFTSQEFRTSDGRIPLLATAIGEESFTDANGNGAFDVGETHFDTSEPFEDDARTGSYASGNFFFDFNNNGGFDGPDGFFNGVLCNDPAKCSGPKSAGIGARNEIILSGTNPSVDQLDGMNNAIGMPTIHPGTVRFWVRDVNSNPMPGGTKVSATVSSNGSAGFTVSQPSSFTVPCTAMDPGVKATGTVFSFGVSSTAAGTGTFTLQVETPSGAATVFQTGLASP